MNAILQASSENQAKVVSRIISTAEQVENMIDSAIQALLGFNQSLAQTVTRQEKEVNQQAALINSELQRQDGREAAAMLKIGKDLEHLAGLAGSIARRIALVNDAAGIQELAQLQPLAIAVAHVSRQTLRALIWQDLLLARNVLVSGNLVDSYRSYAFDRLREQYDGWKSENEAAYVLDASQSLEHIADYSTTVAKNLICWLDRPSACGHAA
jgi:phosphate transport system protein